MMFPSSLLDGLERPPSLSDSSPGAGEAPGSGENEIQSDSSIDMSWRDLASQLITNRSSEEVSMADTSTALLDTASVSTEPSMPIDQNEVVVGFPPGTLIEIYRELSTRNADDLIVSNEDDSVSGTIVSSAPSCGFEPLVPPPLESHGAWAVSPHPQLAVENAHSITTIESVYRNMRSLEGSSSEDYSVDTYLLSLAPSTWMGSSMEDCDETTASHGTIGTFNSSPNARPLARDVQHDRWSFVNVANRLELPAFQGHRARPTEWYSRFTEQDWMHFREEAEMVLQVLEPTAERALPVLPPAPPSLDSLPTPVPYDVSEWLPGSLTCELCQDVIVGAMTLSCGCAYSTVCTSCWESHRISCIASQPGDCDDDDELEYVRVETSEICPFCRTHVERAIPCHPLDVAVLHAVKNLPESSPVPSAYYRRLNRWREEMQRRIAWQSQRRATRSDELLAELIQQEEKYLWKQGTQTKGFALNRGLLLLGEVTVFLAVATISVLTANATARR